MFVSKDLTKSDKIKGIRSEGKIWGLDKALIMYKKVYCTCKFCGECGEKTNFEIEKENYFE